MILMIIDWVDSCGEDGWSHMRELIKAEPTKCRSVGWVAKETDEFIHLVPNISIEKDPEDWRNGEGFGGVVIPRCNITMIQEVV